MTASLDYRKHFFEDIVARKLGYNPRIEIKPAHLANGLFRAICDGYANNVAQHVAAYPQVYPVLVENSLPTNSNLRRVFAGLSSGQVEALRFLDGREQERAMLHALLGADKTLYKLVNTSSYSLSHASQITNDNHDREAGFWLYSILRQGEQHLALDLLLELLKQEHANRNDEISLSTLPLDSPAAELKKGTHSYQEPENVALDSNGQFQNSVIRTIRAAFDRLASNDAASARKNGKLDTLRHFVVLGCFAIYFHLANAHNTPFLTPMVFRFERTGQTLRQASIRSYQYMLNAIKRFMYDEILAALRELPQNSQHDAWDSGSEVERFICDTIDWRRFKTPGRWTEERSQVAKLQQDCLNFYQSYRGGAASATPIEAMAHALNDMLDFALSSTPQDVARGIGTRIGLLSQYGERRKKTYDPHPDFLEVLVRASVPRNETWSLLDLSTHWAESFGILCGTLGDENDRLRALGVAVDQSEWLTNVNAMAELLELSGYARRYADGVTLVSVE